MFESFGIGIVLLDWAENTQLPPLACLIALAGDAAKDFLRAQLNDRDDEELLSEAVSAIDRLALLPELESLSERLRTEITRPSVGLGLAKEANTTWFTQVFSCEKLARQQLGQPLAPRDTRMNFLQPRKDLCDRLRSAFMGPSSGRVFVVIGAEGTGKSWLLANTWMQSDPASILVIVPAGELQEPGDVTGFEDFLIRKLIAQTRSRRTRHR